MKVLKTRSIPASEADFLLQGLQNYHSSSGSVERVSLHVGQRIVNSEDGSLRPTKWDNFLKDKKASKISKSTTFDSYVCRPDPNTGLPKTVPMYQNCSEKPTWPLQDEFCRTMIMLHAPNLEKLEDVKKSDESYEEAFFRHFKSISLLPSGCLKSIQRAYQQMLLNYYNPPKDSEDRERFVGAGEAPLDINYQTPPDEHHYLDEELELMITLRISLITTSLIKQ
jgi:hypothetical protein